MNNIFYIVGVVVVVLFVAGYLGLRYSPGSPVKDNPSVFPTCPIIDNTSLRVRILI